ncbi:taste receptor type 2 member 40-like [Denticeps clupeoides]|uniref:Taste receptor type 2 n=1 Tax=Denticeps clupeoides TaxID=299321 RepID=A0AAY4DZZ1_9TELE|nr:taste receptor type 2 member 40-like [Denticeps clupeoides]
MSLSSQGLQLGGTIIPVCIGVQLNAFNYIQTVLHQQREGGMQTVGWLISSISLSNIVVELSCFWLVALVWMNMIIINEVVQPGLKASLFFWLGSCCVSFWSIAWLSLFYCMKVVSFTTTFFRALKRNISSVINKALLISVLGSYILFSPFFTLQLQIDMLNVPSTTNTTNISYSANLVFASWINVDLYTMLFLCFLIPLPLMIMLPTSLRLVVHLCKHVMALHQNQTQCQSLDSYLRVCKLTVSLVGIYLTTLIIMSFYFISELIQSNVSYHIIICSCTFYCIMSGALLTASNKFLKEKLLKILCCKEPPDTSGKCQTADTEVT